MGGCVTKEQAIAGAQYLDLVYYQFGSLYELLPDASRPLSIPMASKSQAKPPIDGLIGLVQDHC